MIPVIGPPVRKLIRRGDGAVKSLAGPTTLAAMFVANVATHNANVATTSTSGLLKRVSTSTGFQNVSP